MDIRIEFEAITELFSHAHEEGRTTLLEYEVYELLRRSGSDTLPRVLILPKGSRCSDEELTALPGDTVVVKILSPQILHKQNVGGVSIIENAPERIRSTSRRQLYEVPRNYAAWIESGDAAAPPCYEGLSGEALVEAVSLDVQGVLLCQYMPPDSQRLGSELIVGIRRTREFGMIINAGLGGSDAELYAARFRKGEASVAASTALTTGELFLELFKPTISYRKLAGLTRGGKRVVTDEQLLECFSSFIAMANYYSPANPEAPFVIEELEINPFGFTDYLMVPLDGLCRFAPAQAPGGERPVARIDKLLHPESIGVVGVSRERVNIGRTILRNILANGFEPGRVTVIHPDGGEVDGVACVPDLSSCRGGKLDLLVLAVAADKAAELAAQVIDGDFAASVLLIPGGLGETAGSAERVANLKNRIEAAHAQPGGGPVFLGGNSLGILSHPGRYDAMFIPEAKLPKKRGDYPRTSAFISQSGAYLITRMSKIPSMDPAYALSIGNQIDLTAGDLLAFLKDRDDLKVIAVYLEGFSDLDGLAFAKAVRTAVLKGKVVIFYKAGRTPEGKSATAGHTASLAGDYRVCESCMYQAGAIVAHTFSAFEDLFRVATYLHGKRIGGNHIAGVSGAGFEAVVVADTILGEDYTLELATFEEKTTERLRTILKKARLDELVTIKNPLDINPLADDLIHEAVIKALLDDGGVDAIVAGLDPLSPAMRTLPGGTLPSYSLDSEKSIVQRLPSLLNSSDKPVVSVVDGGALYDPLAEALEDAGLLVFRSADCAVRALGLYIDERLRADRIRAGR